MVRPTKATRKMNKTEERGRLRRRVTAMLASWVRLQPIVAERGGPWSCVMGLGFLVSAETEVQFNKYFSFYMTNSLILNLQIRIHISIVVIYIYTYLTLLIR